MDVKYVFDMYLKIELYNYATTRHLEPYNQNQDPRPKTR